MELEAKEAGQIILKHTKLDAEEIRNRTQAKIEEFDGIVGSPQPVSWSGGKTVSI